MLASSDRLVSNVTSAWPPSTARSRPFHPRSRCDARRLPQLRLPMGSLPNPRVHQGHAGGELLIDEYVLGNLTIPLKQILSIQGAADRAGSLLNLQNTGIEAPDGHDVSSITSSTATAPCWLNWRTVWERSRISPPRASVAYRLPAGTEAFLCLHWASHAALVKGGRAFRGARRWQAQPTAPVLLPRQTPVDPRAIAQPTS